jgi:ribonuclease T1
VRLSRPTRRLLTLALGVVVALVWWLSQHGGDAADPGSPAPSDHATYSGSPEGGDRDPESGLAYVVEADLPPEAGETLGLIDSGGPFPHDRDGVVFENRERILPAERRGYYHEYTVPTPGSDDRGARRIVTGDEGQYYWTDDHYASFERIDR